MRKRGWWDTHPQKFWTEADWVAWEKAGRPRVPRAMRLSAEMPQERRLDNLQPLAEPHRLMGAFELNPKPKPKPRGGQSARSTQVDALLEEHGVRPRRRAR